MTTDKHHKENEHCYHHNISSKPIVVDSKVQINDSLRVQHEEQIATDV